MFIRDVSGTEFFLAGAASWIFPEKGEGCCPHGLVTEWSVSDLGDDPPVWGSQTGHRGSGVFSAAGPYDIQTHAVPETRVLLFAAAGCLLFFPRRRVA